MIRKSLECASFDCRGIFINVSHFHWNHRRLRFRQKPAFRERLDTSIYVYTPLDIRLVRRLRRDIEERGRTMESVIQQYKHTVRSMFIEFVEPSKQFADIIVPRGGKNRVAIEVLKARIKQLLI